MADGFKRTGMFKRRRWMGLTALSAALTLVLSSCAASGTEVLVTEVVTQNPQAGAPAPSQVTVPGTADAAPTSAPDPSTAVPTAPGSSVNIITTPNFGSVDLAPTTPISVTVFNADITNMVVTAADGSALTGAVSADGSTWTLGQKLAYAQTYNFAGTATGTDGIEVPIQGQMSTVAPTEFNRAGINLNEGSTYGVASPITLTFSGPVTDRAAVERNLSVTTDKGVVEGSWGWLQDEDIDGNGVMRSQVHFRTKDYWPGNTNVTLTANLYGVNFGGSWGQEDIVRNFKIGRDLRVEADVNSFRLKVYVDGQLTNDFPVSYGKATDPARATRNGVHIVQEHYETFDMCNTQFNYCGVRVKWATRINNNGEFIHENNSTIPQQGKANVSHGCVNMSEANAKIFYDMSIYGDPVNVTNSNGPSLGPSDFNYDWSYSYDQWKALSAL